jgi:prolyl-tRNA synthetase
MRQSQLFTKTRKESPKDETAKNADLIIRAGFINKEMAGVYSYLPIGLKVLKNIENIIRKEMNEIGGQEISMSAFQDKDLWQKTGRWSDEIVDNWFKTKLKSGGELGLGFTHEEPITNMLKEHIRSFRDLPCFPYQFQTKFRNEQRAKSGIIRGREFLMKDLYSFCKDEKEQKEFYEKAKKSYEKIFKNIGLGEKTYTTYASGGTFSKYSDEFQTISDAGEDTIHVCQKCHLAVNEEIFGETKSCPSCSNKNLEIKKIY